jgi:hypothetical protein
LTRDIDGESGILIYLIRRPESLSLAELEARARFAKTAPLAEVGAFRHQLGVARLPLLARRLLWWAGLNTLGAWRARFFGTFGVTGLSSRGLESLHTISPLTAGPSVRSVSSSRREPTDLGSGLFHRPWLPS